MFPNPPLIQFLADQGKPLHLTVSQAGGTLHLRHYRIEKPDGTHITASAATGLTASILELRDMLSHYPHPATINGAPVERTRYNGLTQLARLRHPDPGSAFQERQPIELGPGTPLPPGHNLYAQGVSYRATLPQEYDQEPYYALAAHRHAHWHQLDLIIPSPTIVLSDQTVQAMTPESLGNLINAQRTIEQARNITQKTLAHPDAPRPWNGPVYAYANRDRTGPHQTAPIAVHATPVSLQHLAQAGETSIIASIAHALYNHDAGLVPVAPHPSSRSSSPAPRPLLQASFAWLKPEEPTDDPDIDRVEGITLSVLLQGQRKPRHLPAAALIAGDPIGLKTLFVKDAITPQELARLMAVAQDPHGHQPGTNEETLARAMNAHQGREETLRSAVQQHLDTLAPRLAPGQPPLTASSHDGMVTATIVARKRPL